MISVKMPLIKEVTPQILASEIVGVQPMTDTTITTSLQPVTIDGIVITYYAVRIPYRYNTNNMNDIYEWCKKTFGENLTDRRWYIRGSTTYLFKNEEDRNWFLLRWSS